MTELVPHAKQGYTCTMRACLMIAALILLVTTPALAKFIICSSDDDNDLLRALPAEQSLRAASPGEALQMAEDGAAVLILADHYPHQQTQLARDFYDSARRKRLRLYVEYPSHVEGVELRDLPRTTTWERAVIASDFFAPALKKLRIVALHDCRYLASTAPAAHLVISRVAGYDTAVYGIAKEHAPLLFDLDKGQFLVATTKLSNFITARYAPGDEWQAIWQGILHKLDANARVELNVQSHVRPALSATEPAPRTLERDTFNRAAAFYRNSRLLISEGRQAEIHRLLGANIELAEPPAHDIDADGSLGMLEGYASHIRHDGSQMQRTPIRADCNAEAAMVLSLADDERSKKIATNLLDYVFSPEMQSMGRLDPKHPAFGLIAWGAISNGWKIANYGDDNARVILAAILASAALQTDRWDEHILRALYANLRTTGTLGFRGDRIDIAPLEEHGWRRFHDAATVNFSPHFESYLWACYLWAYRATGDRAFLDKTTSAIRMTMDAYTRKQWRWMDNMERARMSLCLAWLVRTEDRQEHRDWLMTIARDLLDAQQPCGAIQERLASSGGGHYQIPQSNEAYGTTETPLIQQNGDPVSDQLYTTGFALFALHEASAACDDRQLRQAADKLADYLCRIQIRSEKHANLDGGWFRAFDYQRWDYWASSADLGWGAWSIEAGWGPAWTAATLALRQRRTTFWEMTATTKVKDQLRRVRHIQGDASLRP